MEDKIGQQTLEIMGEANFYNQWIMDLIEPAIGGNIIEVGAGVGEFTKRLATKYKSVSASDLNEKYLSSIKKHSPSVSTFLFDLQASTTSSHLVNRFDTVIAINVLEHLPNLSVALKHIHTMLKSGGRVIILIPAFQFAFGSLDQHLGHFQRFTKASLSQRLSLNKFQVVSMRYINFWGLWGWWFNSRILQRKIIPKAQVALFDLLFRPWMLLEKYVSPPAGLSVVCVAQK